MCSVAVHGRAYKRHVMERIYACCQFNINFYETHTGTVINLAY